MFGLTEQEMNNYRDSVQFFAGELATNIIGSSKFLAPIYREGDYVVPDMDALEDFIDDIEDILKPMTINMAYEYAHLQCESELTESEIIKKLIDKYKEYLFTEMLDIGLAFTEDVINKVPVEIVLELPYLYVDVIDPERADEDDKDNMLEERLDAYTKYIKDTFVNFTDSEEEE